MFKARFAETWVRCEKKITTGEVYQQVFVVSQESPITWMYNFKVRKRKSVEEDDLTT